MNAQAQKFFLATASVSIGGNVLDACALVVAPSQAEAHAVASDRLPDNIKALRSLTDKNTHVAGRTLVELPKDVFDRIYLSSALPALTATGAPFVREEEVLAAAKDLKQNQEAFGPALPGEDDLRLILETRLKKTSRELTANEFEATIKLLTQGALV